MRMLVYFKKHYDIYIFCVKNTKKYEYQEMLYLLCFVIADVTNLGTKLCGAINHKTGCILSKQKLENRNNDHVQFHIKPAVSK